MAIQFARCEYVSRSAGGNACRKASYNQRTTVHCERTGELFSFTDREGHVYHEILLPSGADEKFENSNVLWNEVEMCEKRKDSQLLKEIVLALPDDPQVTLEDRIELCKRFSANHFVDKGLVVQIDIHEPDKSEKNWHAHLLIPTRRLREDGQTFERTKARDLDPTIRKGLVIEADVWGEHWRDLQNAYFEEKGYDLDVDPIGILSQEHLGPIRMRHHMNEAISRSQKIHQVNQELAKDPKRLLEALTRTKAAFSQKDIELFLNKHVPFEIREKVFEDVISHQSLVSLYDQETTQRTDYYTTKIVRAEEEKLFRFAASIAERPSTPLSATSIEKGLMGRTLTEEQHHTYAQCVHSGQNLCLIQGRAGVGKTYVLNAIRAAHEAEGYRVLGLAPTHKVAQDLSKSGFESKTCHSFLFALKNHREKINAKTVVIVDEAGMLGTTLSVELFHKIKKHGAKLICVGDDRQLSAVDRGGVFRALLDQYPSCELTEVRRQPIKWQKTISEDLSQGKIQSAVALLESHGGIHWLDTKAEALIALLKAWEQGIKTRPDHTKMILAHKNIEVDALNAGARDILKSLGKLENIEITCQTQRGKSSFAVGDWIQLTKTEKMQELRNGQFGTIESINTQDKTMLVCFENGERKEIDPQTYRGLRHGYASTIYRAQGSTLDSAYVLHSNTSNHSTSYVALTRQTKSLSLFVSKDETPHERALLQQISRHNKNTLSLNFATKKDIQRKLQDKTFTTSLKEKAERLLTKVKDAFHHNPNFYKVPQDPQIDVTAPTLSNTSKTETPKTPQEVYQEMKNPLFTTPQALAVKHAFEKGLKVHGIEKAIAYWESQKEGLMKPYNDTLNQCKKELNSPHLKHLTAPLKAEALTWAKENPTRVFNLLQKLKAKKSEPLQDKELITRLRTQDSQNTKEAKQVEQITQENMRSRSLNPGRGGLSL